MFSKLKQRLQHLRAGAPGSRFETYFSERHTSGGGGLTRVLLMALSLVIVLIGLVLMPLPGPGMLIVASGLAILAGESLTVSRWLDRSELWVRQRFARWRRRTP